MPRLEPKYQVVLTAEIRTELEAITRMHTVGAAKLRRAKILLLSADGCTDQDISKEVGLCERQAVRIRQKFVKSNEASPGCEIGLSRNRSAGSQKNVTVHGFRRDQPIMQDGRFDHQSP